LNIIIIVLFCLLFLLLQQQQQQQQQQQLYALNNPSPTHSTRAGYRRDLLTPSRSLLYLETAVIGFALHSVLYWQVFDREIYSAIVQMSSAPNGLMLFIATSCLIFGSQAFRLNLVNPLTSNHAQKLSVTKIDSCISQQQSERKIIYIRFPLPHSRDEVIQRLKNDIVLSKAIEGTFLFLNHILLYFHLYDSL
jgi:hypothetical protein